MSVQGRIGNPEVYPGTLRGHQCLITLDCVFAWLWSLESALECDDFSYDALRLLVSAALMTLMAALPVSAGGQSYTQDNPLAESAPSPNSIPSSELRNMSAAEFQRHIDGKAPSSLCSA